MSSALRVLAEPPHSASVTRKSGLDIPASSAAFPAEIFPRSNSFTAAATNKAGARASGDTVRARARSSGICTVIMLLPGLTDHDERHRAIRRTGRPQPRIAHAGDLRALTPGPIALRL